MQDLIVFILAVSGLSWIVTRSIAFRSLREFVSHKKNVFTNAIKNTYMRSLLNEAKLSFYTFLEGVLNCHGCFGFWAAFICYPLQKFGYNIILYTFIGSIASLLVIGIINFLERK